MAIILSYIFYFVAASISPLQRRWLATRDYVSHEGQIDFAFKTAGICSFLSLTFPFFSPLYFHGNRTTILIMAVACGLFGAAYWMSLFSAQSHVDAGVTNIVLNIYTPVTIILATLFLNEKLSAVQLIGTSLLLVGMIIVSKKHRIGMFKFDKYFLLVLFSGVMLGMLLTIERALIKYTGFSAGTILSWGSQLMFLGIAVFATKSSCKYSKKDISITGGFRFLQSLSWVILIVVVGNLSLVSAVTTFKVVIIFIAAAIFLKEREDLQRKTVGSLIALVGLLLMK